MKKLLALMLVALSASFLAAEQTLRIDYYHTGHASLEIVSLDRLQLEGEWSGNPEFKEFPFPWCAYRARLEDPESGKTIYSTGFNSLFYEYTTMEPAKAGEVRTFHESVRFPDPGKPVLFVLEKREGRNFKEVFRSKIDPSEASKEPPRPDAQVVAKVIRGDPSHCFDMVMLAEGYTAKDKQRFISDFNYFARLLVSTPPYSEFAEKINFYGVFVPSQDEGCDEPDRGKWRRTALEATFNSFGSPRYLLAFENKLVRDAASVVPYDLIVILVNTDRYGGGGIFNLYSVVAAHNSWRDYLFLHELGHAFAGLADEYYSSSVAYSEFFPAGEEPAEPNITALVDFDSKWKSMLDPGTPVPTPWEKEKFDELQEEYSTKRKKLLDAAEEAAKSGDDAALEKAEKELDKLSKEYAEKFDDMLRSSKWAGKIGVYEGAGYASKGLYRPFVDCIMFSKGKKPYCPVCSSTIRKVLEYYTKGGGS